MLWDYLKTLGLNGLAPLAVAACVFLVRSTQWAMLQDRGDLLKYALAKALSTAAKVIRGARQGLPVMEREAIAEAAVAEIRGLPDDPWKLAEPLPPDFQVMSNLGAPTPSGWAKPK